MTSLKQIPTAVLVSLFAVMMTGCSATPPKQPVTTVKQVDLQRFMGPWYVIACIPTFIDREAFNAVESYHLDADGTIATTFTFNKGSLDGPLKRYTPRGFVLDNTNARWGMRFVWPIKADYRISYVSDDYSLTVVGREARDYVWIMARTPQIAEADYQRLVAFVAAEGYDLAKLRRIPHQANPNVTP